MGSKNLAEDSTNFYLFYFSKMHGYKMSIVMQMLTRPVTTPRSDVIGREALSAVKVSEDK